MKSRDSFDEWCPPCDRSGPFSGSSSRFSHRADSVGVADNSAEYTQIGIPKNIFRVVKEGMRRGVTDPDGTARALNIPEVAVAAKTGTAELGVSKQLVNSWGVGFFPYNDPRYAFALVMEKGSRENSVGANLALRNLLIWMASSTPEYLK